MKQTVTETMFIDEFQAIRPQNFSIAGLRALFAHLEELEQDSGEEMELDVIALCCEFSEHQSAADALSNYEWGGPNDPETEEGEALEFLRDTTTVIEFDGGIIIGYLLP
jgi:hypothetical protein